MHNPPENLKDNYVATFENLMGHRHEIDANDEKLREEIRKNLEEDPNKPLHVSADA